MRELLLVLLGIGIWQLIVFITILITNEDEGKVFGIGIGVIGWVLYGLAFAFVKTINFLNKFQKSVDKK